MTVVRTRARTATVAMVAALCLLPVTTAQAASTTSDLTRLEGQLVELQRLGFADDVDARVAQISDEDPALGAAWGGLADDWSGWLEHYQVYGSTTDATSQDAVPDGLPDGSGHVFVVLGNVLNSDGTAKPELIDRLEVTKAAALKYPDSRILVTGGHTAGDDKASEGEVMDHWLVANGIDPDRIFVETESHDTPDNATMSMPILYGLIPDDSDLLKTDPASEGRSIEPGSVTSVSVITSAWHARRGNVLIDAESRLLAARLGLSEPIQVLAGPSCMTSSCQNSGYVTPPAFPDQGERNLIAMNVAKVASDLPHDAGLGDRTDVSGQYDDFKLELRRAVAKVVYLQQSGFAGDDSQPRDDTADLQRAIDEAGALSTTYGTELPGLVAAWDQALRPMTLHSSVPDGLPTDHHAFVLMGADGGTSQAMANRVALTVQAMQEYPGSIAVVAGNQGELDAGYDGLVDGGIAESRIVVAQPSSNAQGGAVNAMTAMYDLDGQVTSYTLIVSGNYLRRPTVLFAVAEILQRHLHRADQRITPVSAITETGATGIQDAKTPSQGDRDQIVDNVNDILANKGEYSDWQASPPVLSTLEQIAVTRQPDVTRYVVGDDFDPSGLHVEATIDNGTTAVVDVSDAVTVAADTSTVGTQAATVTYSYRGVTRTASVPFTVRAASVAALQAALDAADAIDPSGYTTASAAALTAATAVARAVVADLGSSPTEVAEALRGVDVAVAGLVRRAAPSLTATPSSSRVVYGTPVTVHVRASLVGEVVRAGTVTAREGSTVLGRATVAAGSTTIALPRTLGVGRHHVALSYAPATGTGVLATTTPTVVTVKVTKTALKKLAVKAAKKKIRRKGFRAHHTVKLKVKAAKRLTNGTKAKGKVKVKVRKKTVKKIAMKRFRTHHGTVRVTIKKRFVHGKKLKVKARFRPKSTKTTRKKTAKVTLRRR